MKHFGITNRDSDGNNVIVGIIQNIPKSHAGIQSLNERLRDAVGDHLDIDEFNIDVVSIEDIFGYKPKEVSIEVDGMNYFVEVEEVFFY